MLSSMSVMLPLRPLRHPRPGLRDRHPAAHRQRLAARRPRLQLHPHRHRRPLPAHARQEPSSTRWAGTTTACPPSAASRTSPACAATRRCRSTRLLGRPSTATSRRTTAPCRSAAPTSSSCASELTAPRRAGVRGAVPPPRAVVDWSLLYTTIGDRARRVSQRAFLRNLARGEAYQQDAPTLWDVDFRTAVAQAEMEDRERPRRLPPARLPPHRRAAIWSSTPPAPSCSPSCVALVAHPDDERYQPLFGTTVRTPLFGVEVPVLAHHLADPEKGTGIAMICTFGDVTDVTWWRELDLPTRALIGFDGRIAAEAPEWITDRGRARRLRADRRPRRQAGAEEGRRAAAGVRRDARRAAPDHPPGQVLREGRPPARDRRHPPVVHPQRRPRRRRAARGAVERGSELTWHPPLHAGTATTTGSERPQRRLAHQPPALLRRADPGLVPARRRRQPRLRPPCSSRARPAADRPVAPTCPPGFTSRPARPARRLRRRPRRHGHVGHLVAHPADRRRLGDADGNDLFDRTSSRWTCARRATTSSAPGCSPPWCAATTSTAPAVAPRRAVAAGSSTPTARRCPRARATWSRRCTCSSSTAPTRCATGPRGPPRVDTAFDEGQMKIGRKLAIKLLNASKFVLGFGEPRRRRTGHRPLDRAMLGRLAAVVDDATAAFDGFDYARALERTEDVLLVVLRRLRRAGEGPRLRHPGRVRRPVGGGAALALSATRGRSPRSCRSSPTRCGAAVRPVPARASSPIEVRGGTGGGIRAGDAARAAIDAALADLRDAGSIDTVVFEPGDQVDCTVTLAPPAD
jgi:hypothetical protein